MKSHLAAFFIVLVGTPFVNTRAEVRVAFFAATGPEWGARFEHVAISVGSGWLHADSPDGVSYVARLESIGVPSVVLANQALPDFEIERVRALIGLPYDRHFRWDDRESSYCAKLVGQLLAIAPSPMRFRAPGWRGIRGLPMGEPGLSPDEVYEVLRRKRDFRPVVNGQASNFCEALLREAVTLDGR